MSMNVVFINLDDIKVTLEISVKVRHDFVALVTDDYDQEMIG